jgi:hypothetical protein
MSIQTIYYHNKIKNMTPDELKEFKEKRNAYYKKWYAKNKERVLIKNRIYMNKNKPWEKKKVIIQQVEPTPEDDKKEALSFWFD